MKNRHTDTPKILLQSTSLLQLGYEPKNKG